MYSSNPRAHGATAGDVALVLFRLAIATVVIVFQLTPEATSGWASIWQEKAWPLADTVSSLGVPQAQWVTASAVVLAFLGVIGVATGFVTRLSAIVLLGATALQGYSAVKQTEVSLLELAIVYACIFVYLLLRGPGHLSADSYFRKPSE
ncbi:MAG: DoxX family protein [Verrucomicrobiae bacterium]|nr:DoxX family protein [Verrucomicrobiae bacterium]